MKTFLVIFMISYAAVVLLLFIRFRTKIVTYAFIASFLLVILLPLVFLDSKSVTLPLENRRLAEKPKLTHNGAVNFGLPGEIDDYINDRFGFRKYFTLLYYRVNYNILKKKQDNRVLIGKDGWLYYIDKYGENLLADFQKNNLLDDADLAKVTEQLEKRAQWCSDNGMQFMFFIAPNKHSVYPEHYSFDRPEGLTRADQILNNMPQSLFDKTVFPRDYIISQKETNFLPLYFETDTHWNQLGTLYAYERLFDKIRSCFPGVDFPVINNYSRTVTYDTTGDLVSIMGLESYSQRTIVEIEPEGGWESYYSYKKYEGRDGLNGIITESNNQNLPKAIIFRDSFFYSLQPYTSSLFSHAEYIWRQNTRDQFEQSDKDHILENKPDIVIWEVAERFLGNIPESKWD
ncbi:MAG: hypothetical protein LBK08_06210 [Treponema sp.]|jgi:hypothetical protein|nr:hypothetical protein [Treponema sp.]